MAAGLSPCGALVRDGDHDRYLTVLAGGGAGVETLFALYAFNLELARTADVVREAILGEIRLQWWRDAVASASQGRPPRHAVAEGLVPLLASGRVGVADLDGLIDARLSDLDSQAPAELSDLIAYAEATAGALNRLAAKSLGIDTAATLAAATQIGTAWGLVGLLRATPFVAGRGRVVLPQSLLAAAGVAPRDVIEGRQREAIGQVARQIATEAGNRLSAARRAVPCWPRGAAAPFLLASLTDLYLLRLMAVNWDLFDGRLALRPSGRAWRLAWQGLRRRT